MSLCCFLTDFSDSLVCVGLGRMKVIAAYLLAVLGGNTSPSAGDLKNILNAGTSFNFIYVLLFFEHASAFE